MLAPVIGAKDARKYGSAWLARPRRVIGLDAAGTRFHVSPCGTWKAKTRSGPCDARTTREQDGLIRVVDSGIEGGRAARRRGGFLPFSRNSLMQ